MFKRLLSIGLVGVLSVGMMTTSVFAADDNSKTATNDVSVNISSGGLELKTPEIINFEDVVIKSEKETYYTGFNSNGETDGNVRVSDLRGTAQGWNVKVKATQFANGSAHQLPKGSLAINGVKGIVALDGTTNNMPTSELSETDILDDGDVLIANANKEHGLGVYDIQFNDDVLGLTVDAKTAKTGSYTSTLTWTLESTPDIN